MHLIYSTPPSKVKEKLVNLTGRELGSPAPRTSCYPLFYGPSSCDNQHDFFAVYKNN